MNPVPALSVPPPLPSAATSRPASSFPWKIIVAAVVLAFLLITAECVWLRQRQQARHIAWANEKVEEKIATARVHMNAHRWEAAIDNLEDALGDEEATNRKEARAVLDEARRGQAETILEAAGSALAHRQAGEALRLLHAYLDHPQAGNLERARLLREDLERALSDDEAANWLARLSDEALAVFARKGQLTADDGLHTAATRAIFEETLRRNLDREIHKREARREAARKAEEHRAAEHARRIARLRNTPAFQSLTAFLERARQQSADQQQLAQQQQAELEQLFEQFRVNDPAEKQQFRDDFLGRDVPVNLRREVERKRTEVKRAYHTAAEVQAGDRELFELLVDREVDAFLKTLPP